MSAVFEDGATIAEARDAARDFLTMVRDRHAVPVSDQAIGMALLVVSELVTNARKYAPGPCRLELHVSDGTVEIGAGDDSATQPSIQSTDPDRVGQHGLELVMAVSQSFCVHQEPGGKRITAVLPLTDAPSNDPQPGLGKRAADHPPAG
ncbi:hypothetical protein B0675_26660 [Streptomyces sp. M41(2017)]|nr:hypothetical protein B0675_26660 [Streptomyces sp. M41(2017)]